MNEFILEEKHEYWDNKITLEEYIKNLEECGYIDCSSNFEYEYWYILENLKKLNNLQSKIDKAIEYIENCFIFDDENGEYYQTHTFDKDNAKELRDILKKED